MPRFALCFAIVLSVSTATAGDWPQWRYDAGRTAASPDDLPTALKLSWVRKYAPREQVWDDPLNHDLMPYDRVFEPIVVGRRLVVPFNDRDKVVALDIDSGRELWTFYCDGPVRLPPAAAKDKLYVVSDDGWLYCLGVADGAVVWKFRGAPGARKSLGNKRLISSWPARGGPAVRDGTVYFAASIWPLMGTFLYALDADTGKVHWVNDGTGAQFIQQPHGAPSFAGVAPQGALVATEKLLLVPGGRSAPAAFDRATGQFQYFQFVQKGIGGSFVCADEKNSYIHTRLRETAICDLAGGKPSKGRLQEPVLFDGGRAMVQGDKIAVAAGKFAFNVPADGSGDLIRAGSRIYAAGKQQITALDTAGKTVWTQPVDGEVLRLLAGADRLIAVTLDGRIMVFGPEAGKAEPLVETPAPLSVSAEATAKAKELLAQAAAAEGYALWFGADDVDLLQAVLDASKLHVVAIDADPARVASLRQRFDAAGKYGNRIAVHQGNPRSYAAPPYIASLVVVGRSVTAECSKPEVYATLFESVRPDGGVLVLCDCPADLRAGIADAKPASRTASVGTGLLVYRDGPLAGAADWTHQYGDIANTVKSNDRRVKLPLGVLWFGGSSNLDVLPRHGHGPPQQVVGGRLFIEGLDCLSARDVYTGRVLWKRTIDGLENFGVYFNETYQDTPLSTEYNQKHIPGANGRGTNYVATDREVYVVIGSRCEVLDAATGQTLRTIEMPAGDHGKAPLWGFIGVYEDLLLGGAGFANYTGQPRDLASRDKLSILDLSASDGLVAFDRHSGKVLWRIKARHSFLHNGIVAGGGRVYCLDRLPSSVEDQLKRRGAPGASNYRIVALDAKTGREVWQQQQAIFGTWLSYSQQRELLLQAGAKNSDRLSDEVDLGMMAFHAQDGSVAWQDLERKYNGPCILHNDTILTNVASNKMSSGAFSLLSGKASLVANPLTGRDEPWQITRKYGCNSIVASEYLLTFRSGAAGFYDLSCQGGTGNFGGFKSSCTSNLLAADGVLNAPDYTRTCSCAYQNQTSLAMVHMPENELWTYNTYKVEGRLRQVGINLGAPGDRRSDSGTMWLEHPSVGGEAPPVVVEIQGDKARYFRHHAAGFSGQLPWVVASGVEGADSVSVRLAYGEPGPQGRPAPEMTVRLYFAEPEEILPGQRVFDVNIDGKPSLKDFDIAKEAGAVRRGIMREFKGLAPAEALKITLQPKAGSLRPALVCGVEVIAGP